MSDSPGASGDSGGISLGAPPMDFDLAPTAPTLDLPASPGVSESDSTDEAVSITQSLPSGSISDTTYRSYDGPLKSRAARWWVVALAAIRPLRKRWGFWVWSAVILLPYLFSMLSLYEKSKMGGRTESFGTTFYQAFTNPLCSFVVFILAIMIGAAAISNDLRSNALLIYLSKPITRLDYLLGKWVGVFVPLASVMLAPALLLYIFCLLTFSSPQPASPAGSPFGGMLPFSQVTYHQSFWHEDPYLIFRILGAAAAAAAIHTTLVLGCSAWSKTSRVAGSAYAVLYLLSTVITGIIVGMHVGAAYRTTQVHGRHVKHFLPKLTKTDVLIQHLNVEGVISGLAQHLYRSPDMTFNLSADGKVVPAPLPMSPLGIMVAVAIGLLITGILAAHTRVRAVEVVRG